MFGDLSAGFENVLDCISVGNELIFSRFVNTAKINRKK